MTDDEFTINEPEDKIVEALKEVLEKVENRMRDDTGITRAFSEITTLGACTELVASVRKPAEAVFLMDLPGIPLEEQMELHDRFEVLWDARREQVKRSVRYAGKAYDVTRKEADE